MDAADLVESLRLLERVDQLLSAAGDLVLCAHLMAVIEPLRDRAHAAGLGRSIDGHAGERADGASPSFHAR